MSCSNPFICGIRKYDQHKITKNTPNNQALHNEGEKRLQELLQQRNQQDQGIYSQVNIPPSLTTVPITSTIAYTVPITSSLNTTSPTHYYSLSG